MAETDIKIKSLPKKSKLNMLISMPAITLGTLVCFVTIVYMGMNNRNIRVEAVEAQRLYRLGSMNLNSTLADCVKTRAYLLSTVPKVYQNVKEVEADTKELEGQIDKAMQENQAAMTTLDEQFFSIEEKLREAAMNMSNLTTELQQYGVTPNVTGSSFTPMYTETSSSTSI